MTDPRVRARLERIFRAGLAAADPVPRLEAELGALGDAPRLHVLAIGKAAAPMARALEDRAGDRIAGGLVVTKDGHGVPLERCALLEAGHPVPDARSEHAGRAALRFAAAVPPEDPLVVLLSGGASSLSSCPADGLTAEDLALANRVLLGSGAPIDELNAVRKHLSALSGGRLAQATRARRVHVWVVSDVAGDRLDVIGSGPFAADPSRFEDALDVLEQRGVVAEMPDAVVRRLRAGAAGDVPETPKPGDATFARVEHRVLASNRTALEGALHAARAEGLSTRLLSHELEGEARDAGRQLVALSDALRSGPRTCLLAGGEPTVTLDAPGRGGRCQELALAAAVALEDRPGAALLAAGTDGTDGPTDAAGAHADAGTVARGRTAGSDAHEALRRHDSHAFFAAEGGLFHTGPTGTNVRDLVLVEVGGAPIAEG